MLKKSLRIEQTRSFARTFKKLRINQRLDLEDAIYRIVSDPEIGDKKSGDLSDVYVFKFKMVKQLWLLAYTYDLCTKVLILIAVGPHENFYRDLKNC